MASLISALAALARQRVDNPDLYTNVAVVAIAVVGLITVALMVDYRLLAGQFFGGTNRYRIHVLTVGDIAIIILAFQFWIAGLSLLAVTAVIFTHNIHKARAHVAAFGPPPEVATSVTPADS